MSTRTIQELETVIAELFDVAYPPLDPPLDPRLGADDPGLLPNRRTTNDAVAPALGPLVTDTDKPRLCQNRNYFRVNFIDFFDFATSNLPPTPLLRDFPDKQASFYASIDPAHFEPFIDAERGGVRKDIAITDAVTARSAVSVSCTMRFAILHRDDTAAPGQPMTDQGELVHEIAIITFAPPAAPAHQRPETLPLEEWDRYFVLPPTPSDAEWRLTCSGIHSDYLFEQARNFPENQNNEDGQAEIAKLRKLGEEHYSTYAPFFELARLALHLPAYFEFMYDLVVSERVQTGYSMRRRKTRKRSKKTAVTRENTPVFKVVKSINIIHPPSDHTSKRPPRTWTAPAYRYAVRGHWRHYEDPSVHGHDRDGNIVRGKTWISDYEKGEDKDPTALPTTSKSADPNVTIYIKQTLAYARDVITSHQEHGVSPQRRSNAESSPSIPEDSASPPSREWQAQERAKLTAGLRILILNRDGYSCRLCGKSASSENYTKLEVDHIIPVSKWGCTKESNLQTLCQKCNRGKGSQHFPQDNPAN